MGREPCRLVTFFSYWNKMTALILKRLLFYFYFKVPGTI